MDEARAMLDQLMGKTRNLSETQKDTVQQLHFSDDQVCKYFLCGLCPYIAFNSTKSDMGKCPYPICGDIDANTCKAEWDKLSQDEKDKYGYERQLLNTLENIVRQCDKKIAQQKCRAEQDLEFSDDDVKRIAVIYRQIEEFTDQCEAAADAGDIDKSLEIVKQLEQLKEAARKILNPPEEKRVTVCEVSGNFMSSRDNDERMRAHFEGKQFMGWKMVRDKYAELLKQNPPEGIRGYRGDRDRGLGGGRGRSDRSPGHSSRKYDRQRSRERSRDRGRHRRHHDRERSRDRDRSRDRSGGRSRRGHDRPRGHRNERSDRDRSRSRSKDRVRSRERSRRGSSRGKSYERADGKGNGADGSKSAHSPATLSAESKYDDEDGFRGRLEVEANATRQQSSHRQPEEPEETYFTELLRDKQRQINRSSSRKRDRESRDRSQSGEDRRHHNNGTHHDRLPAVAPVTKSALDDDIEEGEELE
mmetsp:Transcript_6135/g.9249  ORF Transcript_6135/g.9249 Transcript_6135/m.9249 type:complete len:473 (-) Transcript_6135:168-1586(-)|eukprot:CAMPEP_0185030914 /NCGR_PEP_ID=MMETSP1103-20130426/18058_1 /TAXON_ID=36769 /ORGANISM="Paraphysomonas bandaiensis, Strain Caron Lab Isolate" /LENGTH=472 /DNA_ID=CAMNT_0027566219 /DNA_START=40 /DNA_END=1458 /DNA_ORIENTATION=+